MKVLCLDPYPTESLSSHYQPVRLANGGLQAVGGPNDGLYASWDGAVLSWKPTVDNYEQVSLNGSLVTFCPRWPDGSIHPASFLLLDVPHV